MDNTLSLSSSILGDLMLESSGLSHVEQLMVLTSTDNNRDFDVVAKALLEQHSKVHLNESKNSMRSSRRRHLPTTPDVLSSPTTRRQIPNMRNRIKKKHQRMSDKMTKIPDPRQRKRSR